LKLQLLNLVIYTDVCDVAIGSQLFVLSYRHVEYRTPLKKVKCGRRVRGRRSTPSDTPFTELGVLLWKQLPSRAYVSMRHGQDIDKSRWWCQNILCFFSPAVPCFHSHSSFSCISHVCDPSCLLLPSLYVRRKCSFMQFVLSVRNRHVKTSVFKPFVCTTERFSPKLLNICC
jgi:hypothetical protein